MKKNGTFWGIILILFGVLVLVCRIYNVNGLNIGNLWPLFILIPGLSFEYGYFSTKRDPGVLVPGGILTTIGLLFLFETFTKWNYSEYTWPVYLLAVAIGLFQLYLHGQRSRGLLIPVFIFSAVAVISFISMVYGNLYNWANIDVLTPILLIALGVIILVGSMFKKK